jgi:hypothetical protein
LKAGRLWTTVVPLPNYWIVDTVFFVSTWANQQGQMSPSIANAVDPTRLVLVMFQATERKNLPERINVVAIHAERIDTLSRASVVQ